MPKGKTLNKDFTLKFLSHDVSVYHKTWEEIDELFKEVVDKKEEFIEGVWSPSCDLESIWILDNFILGTPKHLIILLHELLEAMNDKFDLKLPHSQINTISEIFGTILVENKDQFLKLLQLIKLRDKARKKK